MKDILGRVYSGNAGVFVAIPHLEGYCDGCYLQGFGKEGLSICKGGGPRQDPEGIFCNLRDGLFDVLGACGTNNVIYKKIGDPTGQMELF